MRVYVGKSMQSELVVADATNFYSSYNSNYFEFETSIGLKVGSIVTIPCGIVMVVTEVMSISGKLHPHYNVIFKGYYTFVFKPLILLMHRIDFVVQRLSFGLSVPNMVIDGNNQVYESIPYLSCKHYSIDFEAGCFKDCIVLELPGFVRERLQYDVLVEGDHILAVINQSQSKSYGGVYLADYAVRYDGDLLYLKANYGGDPRIEFGNVSKKLQDNLYYYYRVPGVYSDICEV